MEFQSNASSSPLFYFKNDPELPIYSRGPSSYCLPQLIDILMSDSLTEEKVCKVHPLGVTQNCTFIIDLDSVSIDDLRADDLGSWKSTGTRRSYFKLHEMNEPEFLSHMPPEGCNHFVVIHRYYVHQTYGKFHHCIVEIQGEIHYCI